MGTWGYGVFDDDTAYDFFDDIEENAKDFFKTTFETAIHTFYLEFEECHMVTVSAAYLDNYLNGTKYRTNCHKYTNISNVNLFQKLIKGLELEDLKEIAVKALNKVIGEHSELSEFWSENEEKYPKWKENIAELIDRLK